MTTKNMLMLQDMVSTGRGREIGKDANNMWNRVAECVKAVVQEVLEVSKGSSNKTRGEWKWNE